MSSRTFIFELLDTSTTFKSEIIISNNSSYKQIDIYLLLIERYSLKSRSKFRNLFDFAFQIIIWQICLSCCSYKNCVILKEFKK